MNKNKQIWEKEYYKKNLMRGDKPQRFFLNFVKFVKKEYKKNNSTLNFFDLKALDLGAGEGKNSIYLAERGLDVYGIEFASNAIRVARELAREKGVKITMIEKSFGSNFDLADDFFDIIVDINSSNSLNEIERKIYVEESFRVLKSGGYFFVRIPAKDGDSNAKKLLKQFPAKEKDTYIIPEFGLKERVFSREDLIECYGKLFEIVKLEKETRYTTYGSKKYKRNFWILVLRKG
jgi:SAM-dependent methyltransferase